MPRICLPAVAGYVYSYFPLRRFSAALLRAELMEDCPRELPPTRSGGGGDSPGLHFGGCSWVRVLLPHFLRPGHANESLIGGRYGLQLSPRLSVRHSCRSAANVFCPGSCATTNVKACVEFRPELKKRLRRCGAGDGQSTEDFILLEHRRWNRKSSCQSAYCEGMRIGRPHSEPGNESYGVRLR